MARATTKTDLPMKANSKFQKIWTFITSMNKMQQNTIFAFKDRDKNIRDILVHLYK